MWTLTIRFTALTCEGALVWCQSLQPLRRRAESLSLHMTRVLEGTCLDANGRLPGDDPAREALGNRGCMTSSEIARILRVTVRALSPPRRRQRDARRQRGQAAEAKVVRVLDEFCRQRR